MTTSGNRITSVFMVLETDEGLERLRV